jgi:uncharacterized damage-inducible protein DinB
MTGKEAIQRALQSTQQLLGMYLGDMSDQDLLVRPVPNANHIGWQIGHLIASEQEMVKILPGARFPELPTGFVEQHKPANAGTEPPKGFATKAQYLDLFNKTRAATLAALDKLTDADLDRPTTGPMAQWAPTLGALLLLTANHTMMHAGQFTVVRRKLGKPVIF